MSRETETDVHTLFCTTKITHENPLHSREPSLVLCGDLTGRKEKEGDVGMCNRCTWLHGRS